MSSINLIPDNYFPGCSNFFSARLCRSGPYIKTQGPALNEKVINAVSKNTLFSLENLERDNVEITLGCEENSPFHIFPGDKPSLKSDATFKRKSFIVKPNQGRSFSIIFNPGKTGSTSKIEISVIRDHNQQTAKTLEFTLTIFGHNLASINRDIPFYDYRNSLINNVAFPLAAVTFHQESISPPSDENNEPTEQPLLIISDNRPPQPSPFPTLNWNVPREALNYPSWERPDFSPSQLPLIITPDLHVPTSTIMGEHHNRVVSQQP